MTPETPEERLVAFADLFFSKKRGLLSAEKSLAQIRQGLAGFGGAKVEIFDDWIREFCGEKSL
jgi:uncharacterized protein